MDKYIRQGRAISLNTSYFAIVKTFLLSFLIIFCTLHGQAQNMFQPLKDSLEKISAVFPGKIGVAVYLPATNDSFSYHSQPVFPMQSVYKFPLALAVLERVQNGELRLDSIVPLRRKDLKEKTWSPLKQQFPRGNDTLTILDYLKASTGESDNIACDKLFEVMGGPSRVQDWLNKNGFEAIQVRSTEKQIHHDFNLYKENNTAPMAMTQLLLAFYRGKLLNEALTGLLNEMMSSGPTGKNRIQAGLPEGSRLAHKTGTGFVKESLIEVCNDVGIIYLPDGRVIIVSIFVNDAGTSYEEVEAVIARISSIVSAIR